MSLVKDVFQAIRRAFSLTDTVGAREYGGVAPSGSTVTQESALALSAVWACVNLIAGTGASLPLMVYRRDRKGVRVLATDHPLYLILHDSPNADQTAMDFWEFMFAAIELRGNGYAVIDRGTGGRIASLTPLRPDLVEVKRDDAGALTYCWHDGGIKRTANETAMLHIRGFGGSPLGGLSTLSFGRNAFGLAQDIERSASGTFANGMRASGALKFKEWLKAGQRQEFEDALAAKFVGSVNAGRPMVLEGGTEWQQFSINPEDAQMLESRGFSVEEICRFFGVPPIMVGHGEKTSSWGTGVAEVTLGFVKYTLRRRLKRIEQALQKQLLSAADRAAGVTVEFILEGLLRGDSVGRSAFYGSALDKGWMTVNEVRELENLPPVEGGDVCRVQMQNVALAGAGIGHNGGPPLGEKP